MRTKIFVFTALIVFLISCAKKEALRPVVPKAYEGAVTVEALKESIIFNTIGTVKSEANIEVIKNGKTQGTYEGILLFMPPDSANIRVFGPLGLTALDIVLSDNLLQVYVPLKNIMYEGKIPKLRGTDHGGTAPNYSMKETEDSYILYSFRMSDKQQGQDKELVAEYIFSKATLLNTDIVMYSRGEKFAGVSFGDFMQIASSAEQKSQPPQGGIPAYGIPISIKISLPNKFTMNMTLIEPEINSEIPEDYFRIKDYEGTVVIPLQELFKMGF